MPQTDPTRAVILNGAASADQTNYEGYAVTLDSNGRIAVNVTNTVASCGVLVREGEAVDDPCSYAASGIAKAKIGTGGCTKYTPLMPGADGLVTATSGKEVVGEAMETASATEFAEVRIPAGLETKA